MDARSRYSGSSEPTDFSDMFDAERTLTPEDNMMWDSRSGDDLPGASMRELTLEQAPIEMTVHQQPSSSGNFARKTFTSAINAARAHIVTSNNGYSGTSTSVLKGNTWTVQRQSTTPMFPVATITKTASSTRVIPRPHPIQIKTVNTAYEAKPITSQNPSNISLFSEISNSDRQTVAPARKPTYQEFLAAGGSLSQFSKETKPKRPHANTNKRRVPIHQQPQFHYPGEPEPTHKKPDISYPNLVALAILNSDQGYLAVGDIYNFIMVHFPFFRTAPASWKNSIRHNLSMNKGFQKYNLQDGPPQSRACLWTLAPEHKKKLINDMKKFKERQTDLASLGLANPDDFTAIVEGRIGMPAGCVQYSVPMSRSTSPATQSEDNFPIFENNSSDQSVSDLLEKIHDEDEDDDFPFEKICQTTSTLLDDFYVPLKEEEPEPRETVRKLRKFAVDDSEDKSPMFSRPYFDSYHSKENSMNCFDMFLSPEKTERLSQEDSPQKRGESVLSQKELDAWFNQVKVNHGISC